MTELRDHTALRAPTPLVRYTFGGSSIAAAAGIDPYLSRVGLFLRLKGVTPEPASEPIEWGKRLEPLVLAELATRGYEPVPVEREEWRDPARPWLVGHPDGFAAIDAAVGVAEAKTTNRWARNRTDDIPLTWQAQVQTYMHLTHTERAVIGALVDGQRFEVATVARDEGVIRRLLARAEDFYGYLTRDELPPFVGHPNEAEVVAQLYPSSESGSVVRAGRELRKVVYELRLVREAEDATERERKRLEAVVKASMGDAETLIGARDETLVTWKSTRSRRLDTSALREALPDVYRTYTTETNTRRFLLA